MSYADDKWKELKYNCDDEQKSARAKSSLRDSPPSSSVAFQHEWEKPQTKAEIALSDELL